MAFRHLPRMDLVGTLVSSGTGVISVTGDACRQACCATPSCDAYVFGDAFLLADPSRAAPCYLYANVTALVPSSGFSSGARLSVYS